MSHPKILKLYVEKGVSVEVAEGKWRRQAYGVEADVSMLESEEDLNKARIALENKIEDYLQLGEGAVTEKEVAAIPKIDPAELDECDWQTFQKQPAKLGQAGWIKNPTYFTDFEAPSVLLELTKALAKAKDHKLVIGDMEYSLGGKDEMKDHFINRKPVKTEGAK